MRSLDDQALINAYRKSIEMKLDKEFIKQLEEELKKRRIDFKN